MVNIIRKISRLNQFPQKFHITTSTTTILKILIKLNCTMSYDKHCIISNIFLFQIQKCNQVECVKIKEDDKQHHCSYTSKPSTFTYMYTGMKVCILKKNIYSWELIDAFVKFTCKLKKIY